ncbi:hypothetical protein Gpo141_00009612 [Globisporangium polare]
MASSSSSSSSESRANGSVNATDHDAYPRAPASVSTASPSSSKSVSANAGDTCDCRASGVARTCFDCLNTRLQSGATCVVNPYGSCVSAATAVSDQSYFSSTENSSVTPHDNQYFWSSNATYCSPGDVACTDCRTKWVDEYQNQSLRSNFSCVGASGCVCSAYCELRQVVGDYRAFDLYNVGRETCAVQSTEVGAVSIAIARDILSLLVGVLVLGVALRQCVVLFRQRRHDRRMRERRRAQRQQRSETFGIDRDLTLDGWKSYREQLIEREKGGFELKSEPLLMASEPNRVLVDEGERVRSISTSRQVTSQQPRSTRESWEAIELVG